MFFRINNAPLPALNFAGSGFLTDNHGAELGPAVTLEAFPVTHHFHQVGVDLVLRPLTSDVVPVDVYGFHLDLTLPNSPGFGFGDGPPGGVTFDANVFGIGPGIPRDIVPDFGSTALFLDNRTRWLDFDEGVAYLRRISQFDSTSCVRGRVCS